MRQTLQSSKSFSISFGITKKSAIFTFTAIHVHGLLDIFQIEVVFGPWGTVGPVKISNDKNTKFWSIFMGLKGDGP